MSSTPKRNGSLTFLRVQPFRQLLVSALLCWAFAAGCTGTGTGTGRAQSAAWASGAPDELAVQCAAACEMDERCQILPEEKRSQCVQLCTDSRLDPDIRRCMAQAQSCDDFQQCPDQDQAESSDHAARMSKPKCDKEQTIYCPGTRDCSYPEVCCTQIFGGAGRGGNARIHVCGKKDCPWYTFGLGPWCSCASTKSVYGC